MKALHDVQAEVQPKRPYSGYTHPPCIFRWLFVFSSGLGVGEVL